MKLSLLNAAIILLTGMVVVLTGVFLTKQNHVVSHPTILSGLAILFLGTIWLVLCLNQRRNKTK